MAYSIRPHSAFERSFGKLNRDDQKRVVKKLEQLAETPETIGAPMRNLPLDLRGLHKTRVGNRRVFFWVDHGKREIVPYDIDTRDKAYKNLYKK